MVGAGEAEDDISFGSDSDSYNGDGSNRSSSESNFDSNSGSDGGYIASGLYLLPLASLDDINKDILRDNQVDQTLVQRSESDTDQ